MLDQQEIVLNGLTLREAVKAACLRFQQAGLDNAALDARLLAALACGIDASAVISDPDYPLNPGHMSMLDSYIHRRLNGEPVSRIRGWREFWGLRFAISDATLDPRPESEHLVEAVLSVLRGQEREQIPSVILDLGTGSGCLLLSLLSELPYARGLGIDKAIAAIHTASANARALNLDDRAFFIQGDWADMLAAQSVDGVIANPPYIRKNDIAKLSREVCVYDPVIALDGGEDGMDAYRSLIPHLPHVLKHGGFFAFEVGEGQHEPVMRLICQAGLIACDKQALLTRDLSGKLRAVAGVRQAA